MKIHILSDVHNEFLSDVVIQPHGSVDDNTWKSFIPKTDADLIVLAGDINIGVKGVEWAINESKRLNLPIIYVSGNHEYYNQEYYSTLKQMRDTCQGTNVYFLENDEVQIEDVRILGCTLWTDYDVIPKVEPYQSMNECEYALNDHRVIRIEGAGYFSPALAKKTHTESVEWISNKLTEKTDARVTLVVTHHGPSILCQHKSYPVSAISGAFYSDLNELVSKADCWVYGHTHSNLDVMIGNCRLVTNQPGYPSENVVDFDSMKVIEI